MARNASLAIGVSDAQQLPFLRGAVNGAKQFHAWAESVGYESHLLTDEDGQSITVATLRAELDQLLAGEKIHRQNALELYAIDRSLIAALAGRLDRRMAFSLSIDERDMYLSIGADTLTGPVIRLELSGG